MSHLPSHSIVFDDAFLYNMYLIYIYKKRVSHHETPSYDCELLYFCSCDVMRSSHFSMPIMMNMATRQIIMNTAQHIHRLGSLE